MINGGKFFVFQKLKTIDLNIFSRIIFYSRETVIYICSDYFQKCLNQLFFRALDI